MEEPAEILDQPEDGYEERSLELRQRPGADRDLRQPRGPLLPPDHPPGLRDPELRPLPALQLLPPDFPVQLLLDLLQDLRVVQHEEHGPQERCLQGLHARGEQVQHDLLKLGLGVEAVEEETLGLVVVVPHGNHSRNR